MADSTGDGQEKRMLLVAGESIQERQSVNTEQRLARRDVVTAVQQLIEAQGVPDFVHSDSRTEYVAMAAEGAAE